MGAWLDGRTWLVCWVAGGSLADNLKIESDSERVWLSRCTVEDGEPFDGHVTVERLIAGSWIMVEHWQAT
jgi:hypothetical protein